MMPLLIPLRFTCLLFSLAAALAVPTGAMAATEVDTARSSVSIVFRQMAAPVEARFRKFSARVDYDSARPEAAKASVEIDTASLDLGDAEYNTVVGQKEWLDVARFPRASFVSGATLASSAGSLTVSGKLTIKGRTVDLAVPVSVRDESGARVFEGRIPIRRLAFNVGEGEWQDTSVVQDEVIVSFRLVVSR